MIQSTLEDFQSFTPYIINTVHRLSTPKWNLQTSVMKNYNLALVYEGEATFTFDSLDNKLSRGSLVFSKPGVVRSAVTSPTYPAKFYAVDFQYTCPVLSMDKWDISAPELPFLLHERISDNYLFNKLCSLFNDLTKYWISDKPDKKLRSNIILCETIDLLLIKHYGNNVTYDKIRKVNKLIEYMTENYSNPLSLDEMSRFLRISTSHLCSIFREVTLKTPTDYLIGVRINKARDLLSDGMSVTEVSKAVGFNDIYYFSKCFKKHTGITPSKYK